MSTVISWIRMKTFSKESPQAFLDASTLTSNPLTEWTIILKSQPNEKYHQGITSHLCEFSRPTRIMRSSLWSSFKIWAGNNFIIKKMCSESVLRSPLGRTASLPKPFGPGDALWLKPFGSRGANCPTLYEPKPFRSGAAWDASQPPAWSTSLLKLLEPRAVRWPECTADLSNNTKWFEVTDDLWLSEGTWEWNYSLPTCRWKIKEN